MNRQSILQQIDVLVKALTEQQEQLKESSGTIPQMTIDLVLQNTRQLYEAVLLLNHTNALSSLDEVKAAVMQRILAEKRMIEATTAVVKKPQPVASEPVAKEVTLEKAHHSETEEATVRANAARQSEEKKEHAKPKKISGGVNATLFEGSHTLANHFSDEESLHEHIAGKVPGKTLADNLHRIPVTDLKAAIGINEKFLFINQLFDGDLKEYSSAIDRLNNAGNLDAANQLITNELASRFKWPADDVHVKHFIDLVERRFIA